MRRARLKRRAPLRAGPRSRDNCRSGASLRASREAAGLSQNAAADLLHTTQDQVRRWESGDDPTSFTAALYELAMLNTGSVEICELSLGEPTCLELRLPDGRRVRIHLPMETLASLTRFHEGALLQLASVSHCRHIGDGTTGLHRHRSLQ